MLFVLGSQILCFSQSSFRDNYLLRFFQSEDYVILDIQLRVDLGFLNIAVQYSEEENEIIKKGLIFRETENEIIPYLTIFLDHFSDKNGETIFDISKHNYNHYGWKLEYEYFGKNNNELAIDFTYLGGNGSRITDGPSFIWEKSFGMFIEDKIDPSQY